MYKNKSEIYVACKEMLDLMNSELYPYALANYKDEIEADTYSQSLESKAAYLTNSKVDFKSNSDEIDRLIDPPLENKVRIQGMFRDEIICTICYYKKFNIDILSCWFENKPDTEEVLNNAFMKFDTLRNSEVYPFDTLSCQLIVSDCVKGYFDEIIWSCDTIRNQRSLSSYAN